MKEKKIKTKGDKIQDRPLAMVGGKGLFVTEIEDALINNKIDLAVHSMKDMPGIIPDELTIGAIPKRENPKDVLISKNNIKLADLPTGAKIGTSSLRRSSQLCHLRPDIKIVPLRGNLDTRIKKLKSENLDGIILAAAGIKRLGLGDKISEFIDEKTILPAVGQGALCIETRVNDSLINPLVKKLDHHDTRVAVLGERAFLRYLEGNCQIPVAAWGSVSQKKTTSKEKELTLTGLVADIKGNTIIIDTVSGPEETNIEMGEELAKSLLSKGAGQILKKLKLEHENDRKTKWNNQ
ncbi:MAG: hydroxymethylbilane synthase [Desulfobacteraceae bacterium 4572_19]|nr:MAG: hydroxymethylbilane synthase [Desulfobacteraceae bacterium 4572_19]